MTMRIVALAPTVAGNTLLNTQRIVDVASTKSKFVIAGRGKKEDDLSSATSISSSCMRMQKLLVQFVLAAQ